MRLERVPDGVLCVRMFARRGALSVDRRFDVAPGAGSTIDIPGLPTGKVELAAAAYTIPCSEVGSNTPLAWVAEPLTQWLAPREITKVVLKMRVAAHGEVTFDFEDWAGSPLNNCTTYTDVTAPEDPKQLLILLKDGGVSVTGRCLRVRVGDSVWTELQWGWSEDFWPDKSPAYPGGIASDSWEPLWNVKSSPTWVRFDKVGHFGWYLKFDPTIAGAVEVVDPDHEGLEKPVIRPDGRKKLPPL